MPLFRRPTFCSAALVAASFLSLSSSGVEAALAVRSVPATEPVRGLPDQARASQFKRLRFTQTVNAAVGETRSGPACSDARPLYFDAPLAKEIGAAMTFAVQSSLRELGYQRSPEEVSVFADVPRRPVELELGALVQDMQFSFCNRPGAGVEGAAYFRSKWEIYAPQAQKVVFTTAVEGSIAEGRYATPTELYRAASRALVRNFLADPGAAAWLNGAQALPAAVPTTARREAGLRLEAVPAPKGGLLPNATLLRASVLTIEAGTSSGSGFLISRQGYVLTNQHVVKGQRFVKLRLASGRELVGEVVQEQSARDVALIRTETGLDPLPLRSGDLAPGETVYALGSPLGEKFSGSLTRGIVSAYRTRDGQRFIQSDVAILQGSSGGPLLDESGQAVGLAQSVATAGQGRINFFIPIADALKALGVTPSPD